MNIEYGLIEEVQNILSNIDFGHNATLEDWQYAIDELRKLHWEKEDQ